MLSPSKYFKVDGERTGLFRSAASRPYNDGLDWAGGWGAHGLLKGTPTPSGTVKGRGQALYKTSCFPAHFMPYYGRYMILRIINGYLCNKKNGIKEKFLWLNMSC